MERKIAFIQYFIGVFIKLSAKKSNKVIVQTKWMREAVCKKCNINPEKVLCVAPNVNNITHLKNSEIFDKTQFFYPTATDNQMFLYKTERQGCFYYNIQ